MKKQAFTFMAVLATVLLFSGCKEAQDTMHKTYFWTSVNAEQEPLTLFVDGAAVGTLPHFSTELTCRNETMKRQALCMNLRSGKYQLEARDRHGNVKSACLFNVSESGMGSKSGMNGTGKMMASSDGHCHSCVTVNLSY